MAGLGTGVNYIPSNVSFQSTVNTTTTPLAGAATFTGTGEQNQQLYAVVDCTADVAGTLFFDFSVDGVNWSTYPTAGFSLAAGGRLFRSAYKGPRYFRARFVNGAAAQSVFRLYTYFDAIGLLDNALNQPIALDSGAISTRPTSYQDEKQLGLRQGIDVAYLFNVRTDLDTAAGDALISPDNTTNTFNILAAVDTFDIAYNATTDGSGTTGALTLALQYLDANGQLQTGIHVLGATGSDTTSFSGFAITRAVVLTAGSARTNTNSITFTDTTGASVQSYIAAGVGFSQTGHYFIPDNGQAIIKELTIGAVRLGGGSSPVVKFTMHLFNRGRNAEYLVFSEVIDTNVETSRKIFNSVGYRIRATDVVWFTAETDVNNTEVFVRYQIDVHTGV